MLDTESKLDNNSIRLISTLAKALISGKSLFITGAAGTGKSTLLRELKKKLKTKLVLTSTTGVSAINIGGCTIHSFSGIGIHNDVRAIDAIKSTRNWLHIKERVRESSIIAIDEISMLRADTFNLINRVFVEATGSKLPFGGKTLLLVGDFLQLPPVPKKDDVVEDLWCFRSESWKDLSPLTIHLKKVHRQADERFINTLHKIREGKIDADTDSTFAELELPKTGGVCNTIKFFPTNKEAEAFNECELAKLPGTEIEYVARIWGRHPSLEAQIRDNCIALEILKLKLGAKVIVLTNDSEARRFVNGSLGLIVGFDEKKRPIVKIDKTGETLTFEPFQWELKDYKDNILASFVQIPLKLAYGITIHKSQGMTLDEATIDCRRIFAPGQAYVALSRVRTLSGLKLNGWSKEQVFVDRVALSFYERLRGGHSHE